MLADNRGKAHVWLMAEVEVDDIPHILLRGVNWRGEYDAERRFDNISGPWWHTPTVKFDKNPQRPGIRLAQVLDRARQLIHEEWPALGQGKIVDADQSADKDEVEADSMGNPEFVTRIAIKFPNRGKLPKVLLKPGQRLNWPRHPVTWVKADTIHAIRKPRLDGIAREMTTESGAIYVVPKTDQIMETPHGPRRAQSANLPIQASVMERFIGTFGLHIKEQYTRALPPRLNFHPLAGLGR